MANSGQIGDVVRLSDTTWMVAEPATDVRGRKVLDTNGDEVGTVDDLLVDDEEKKVRFLRVGAGGFLGIGERHFLIPVEAVTEVHDEHVVISRDRDRLTGVPTYDPPLTDAEEYYRNVYSWWGHHPHWAGPHHGVAAPLPPPVAPSHDDRSQRDR